MTERDSYYCGEIQRLKTELEIARKKPAPVIPVNQHKSLRPGDIRIGECLCGWLVARREKFCSECGKELDWTPNA